MNKLYFLWDYDIDEKQIRAILRGTNEMEKEWLIARLLTHAKFEDVWKYLNTKDIIKAFPKLRLPPRVKQAWQHALTVWGYHV